MSDILCPCGRKMTAEAQFAHMANCEAVEPHVREINRCLAEALDRGQRTGDFDEFEHAVAAAMARMPWWKRLTFFVGGFWRALTDFFGM